MSRSASVTRIAVSMGDPLGIGPEIIVKSLVDGTPAVDQSQGRVRFLVYGCREVFSRAAHGVGCHQFKHVRWCDTGAALGSARADAGQQQVAALEAAVAAVLDRDADALCTAPINKFSAGRAGFCAPGHTEYLAQRVGAPRHAMMLAGPRLRVVPLTGHLPLRRVADMLQKASLLDAVELTIEALERDFFRSAPRIAVTGLNPHAGEQGRLGTEEQRCLAPALERCRRSIAEQGGRAQLIGPVPADGFFGRGGYLDCDAVICCYHDQALIPFKMLHPDDGVNLTLGLPFVRTSPAHGTAEDIAGQGRANPASMVAALQLAARIHRNRLASEPTRAGAAVRWEAGRGA